jgi:GxxExxY protein
MGKVPGGMEGCERIQCEVIMGYKPIDAEDERIATQVVDAALQVHRALGPGLLESVYEICLAHELRKRGLSVRRQEPVPILYDGLRFEEAFRFDLLVGDRVLCEIKAVQELHAICTAQVLTYLKLMNLRLGILINFNERLIKDGLTRIIL